MRPSVTLAALCCLLAGAQAYTQVGPNGEVDGLTAKFVDVNGVKTRYYDYGQGETIVLLHGGQALRAMQGSANTWSSNISGLARKFRVLALDRIGSGMTGHPKDDRDLGVEGDVEHIYQFIRAMNVDKVHVVGHSSGTAPEVYLALKHPDIVKSVVLVSAGAGRHFRAGPTKLSVILAKCPADIASDEYRKCFRASLLPPQAFPPYYEQAEVWMAKLPKGLEGRQRVAALRSERPQLFDEERAHEDRVWDQVRAGALQVPVLVYGGNQDLWDWDADAPQATMQGTMNLVHTLGAKNPRVKAVVVNGAGHFVYREEPEQFNADLIHFIEFWTSRTSPSRAQ